MKTIKMVTFPFTFLAAAVMLGGCLAAELSEGDEALEVQAENAPVQTAAADLVLEEAVQSSPKWATFEGQRIDLSTGWGEARACLVLEEDVVECFRTKAEADAREAENGSDRNDMTAPSGGDDTIAAVYCGDYAYLCEHQNWGGRCLGFLQRQSNINLSNYGFNDKMTSYDIGPCGVTFYEHANRGGASLYRGPWAYSSNVGTTWNDRVSSIWIW